jgi:hypothetical protein
MIIILYNLSLDSDDHVKKIVDRNVDIDYTFVFKNVIDKFIDKFSRDVMYTVVKELRSELICHLPVQVN